jgi:hypothetical protein
MNIKTLAIREGFFMLPRSGQDHILIFAGPAR